MGAAPAEDSHSRIAQVAACIRALLSIVNTDVYLRVVHRDWETRHMISDAEFAAMKPTAVVINVGRGPVIDEVALLRALTAKRIKGAGVRCV
jgi:phosphoglycerate dehydrogenase-like enzyme